jgi:hypothetical protein
MAPNCGASWGGDASSPKLLSERTKHARSRLRGSRPIVPHPAGRNATTVCFQTGLRHGQIQTSRNLTWFATGSRPIRNLLAGNSGSE